MAEQTDGGALGNPRLLNYEAHASPGIDWHVLSGLVFATLSFAFIVLHFHPPSVSQRILNFGQAVCIVAGVSAIALNGFALAKSRSRHIRIPFLALVGLLLGLIGTVGAKVLPPRNVQIKCAQCLKNISSVMILYAAQNGGKPPSSLQNLSLPFRHGVADFICPTTGEHRTIVFPDRFVPRRNDSILFYELRPRDIGAFVAFTDGEVKFMTDVELAQIQHTDALSSRKDPDR